MNRLYLTIVMLVAASSPVPAQRLDGCPEDHSRPGMRLVDHPTESQTEQRLNDSGYALTKESLLSALRDPRPDVRSLAADRLSLGARTDALSAISEAWSTEKDSCTKGKMDDALSRIGSALIFRDAGHPGGQQRVTPFQSCSPSEPRVLALSIQPANEPSLGPSPFMRITLRNLTELPLEFFRTFLPEQEFSATVTDTGGQHARMKKESEWLYRPGAPGSAGVIDGHAIPSFLMLPPQKDVSDTSWLWRPDGDFDMSTPGTYHVSLGGTIEYLNTTVCSNTIDVTVK